MKAAIVLAAMLTGALAGGHAHAQSDQMRPGLWEHSFTVKSQSGEMERAMREMQQQFAAMPPEQRQMMEQMMAAQGVTLGPTGQTLKVCVTAEEAARGFMPQQDENCTHEVVERSGSSIKVKFSCAGNPPSSGEGEVTFNSPTAYTGKATVNTTVEGRPEQMVMEQTGKWLAADCGSIRPR